MMTKHQKAVRHAAFLMGAVFASVLVGFFLGHLDKHFKDAALEIFTIAPPLIDWAHRMME